jgi:hypothetical protein
MTPDIPPGRVHQVTPDIEIPLHHAGETRCRLRGRYITASPWSPREKHAGTGTQPSMPSTYPSNRCMSPKMMLPKGWQHRNVAIYSSGKPESRLFPRAHMEREKAP